MSIREQLDAIFQPLQEINLEGQITLEEGQRGFGESCDIFRGWSTKHNKKVAVKRIRFFMLKDSSFTKVRRALSSQSALQILIVCYQRLARESRIWSELKHENILPFLGFFLEGENGIPNLVSEWMEKGTVIDYMRARPYDPQELCDIVRPS